jgi:hypothetical protein
MFKISTAFSLFKSGGCNKDILFTINVYQLNHFQTVHFLLSVNKYAFCCKKRIGL